MFGHNFKPCLKTCLQHVYINVYTILEHMFPPDLKICLHNVREHLCNMFGDKFNHVWIHVSTVFKDMFTPCLTTYFYIVWFLFTQYFQTHLVSLIYIMFQDVLTLCMKTCLLKDNQLMAFFETFEPIFIKNWSNCSFGWKWIKNQYNLV